MGRPKKPKKQIEEMEIRFRVRADLHARVLEAAERTYNSVAAFARQAVLKELKSSENEVHA